MWSWLKHLLSLLDNIEELLFAFIGKARLEGYVFKKWSLSQSTDSAIQLKERIWNI